MGLDSEHDQGHPGGITTFSTATIPFSDHAVPILAVLSLVPLHIETGAVGQVRLLMYPAIPLIDLETYSIHPPWIRGGSLVDSLRLGVCPATH